MIGRYPWRGLWKPARRILGWKRGNSCESESEAGYPGAEVVVLADRFYPSAALFTWLHGQAWHHRLRLKGNLNVDPGVGDIVTTGELATGHTERYLPNVRLFDHGVPSHLGILHEAEHPEPPFYSVIRN